MKTAFGLTKEMSKQVREIAKNEEDEDDCFAYTSAENCLKLNEYAVRPASANRNALDEGIYNAAFRLTGDIPMSSVETATVLLFNLGLFQHLKGNESNKTKDLSRSLARYNRVFQLWSTVDRQESVILTILGAALCINMAHIYQSFRDVQNSTNMLDQFKQNMRWLVASD